MRNLANEDGMSVGRAMVDGMAKQDGEHGGKECGGYRLEKVMEVTAGCRRRWGCIDGVVLPMT